MVACRQFQNAHLFERSTGERPRDADNADIAVRASGHEGGELRGKDATRTTMEGNMIEA